MTTNDILKRVRYAVRLGDAAMLDMLDKGSKSVSRELLDSWFLDEGDAAYAECPRDALGALLDGMILVLRGPSDRPPEPGAVAEVPDNNMVLKKLRIALELKEEDLIAIMKLSNVELSRNELTALFRKRGHKNYRECMDQFLRNFLAGLAKYRRSGV